MLGGEHREQLHLQYPLLEAEHPLSAEPDPEAAVKQLTADNFAYEWQQFGGREEWAKNFVDYMQAPLPDATRILAREAAKAGRLVGQGAPRVRDRSCAADRRLRTLRQHLIKQ